MPRSDLIRGAGQRKALINGMEQGPTFASVEPRIIVQVWGDWSHYLDRSTRWGWRCLCGDSRIGCTTKTQAAESAEEHFWWHSRQGRDSR